MWPQFVQVSMTLEEFLKKYESLEDGAHLPGEVVSVAGPLSNFLKCFTLKLQYVLFFDTWGHMHRL